MNKPNKKRKPEVNSEPKYKRKPHRSSVNKNIAIVPRKPMALKRARRLEKNNGSERTCSSCGQRPATHCHDKQWKSDPTPSKNHRLMEKKNPERFQWLCALCHAQIHGISPVKSELKRLVMMRERLIMQKNVLDNQIAGLGRIEIIVPGSWNERYGGIKDELKTTEKEIREEMEIIQPKILPWMLEIKGISHMTIAKLISRIDIAKAAHVSSLWKYAGLTPDSKKARGKRAAWNHMLKKEMYILADSFIKQRTPVYRKVYDDSKAMYMTREGMTKGHAHMMAIRRMNKIFLQHLWLKWRELEGLPVSEPYVSDKLGHTHMIMAEAV